MNPADNFGMIALLAVVAAFLSATFDIVVDAWRIETANSPDDLDTLTTFYQGGYRSAAFIGGGRGADPVRRHRLEPDAGDPWRS